jgi:hypothetical protein
MPNTDLTIPLIRDEVLTNLGYSGVDVELEDSDITNVLRQTLRIYSRNRPRRFVKALSVSSSTPRHELTTATHPGLVGITDVSFLVDSVQDNSDPFNMEGNTLLGLTTFGGETFGEVALRRSYVEDSRRVVSAEPEWTAMWDLDSSVSPAVNRYYLYISISSTTGGTKCSYTWTQAYTPDTDANTGMQNIPQSDVDWILGMVSAKSKRILSKIRGKFSGIPNPDGSESPVDFAELASEGQEEELALMEELLLRRRPLPPVTG